MAIFESPRRILDFYQEITAINSQNAPARYRNFFVGARNLEKELRGGAVGRHDIAVHRHGCDIAGNRADRPGDLSGAGGGGCDQRQKN
jgi:hypothetical protein